MKQEQNDMNYPEPECSRSIQTICSLKYEYEKITLRKKKKGVEQTLYRNIQCTLCTYMYIYTES